MENSKLTFNKSQHLCGETTISQLFREGKAFLVFPLRVVYRVMPRENVDKRPAVRVLTSVPKKQFKHAVDRNRFKRLIRESYRLQQQELNGSFRTLKGEAPCQKRLRAYKKEKERSPIPNLHSDEIP